MITSVFLAVTAGKGICIDASPLGKSRFLKIWEMMEAQAGGAVPVLETISRQWA